MAVARSHTISKNEKLHNLTRYAILHIFQFVPSLVEMQTTRENTHPDLFALVCVSQHSGCVDCQSPLALPPVPQNDCYAAQLYGTSPNELQMFSYWPLLSLSRMTVVLESTQHQNPFFLSSRLLFIFFDQCLTNFFYKNNVVDIFPNNNVYEFHSIASSIFRWGSAIKVEFVFLALALLTIAFANQTVPFENSLTIRMNDWMKSICLLQWNISCVALCATVLSITTPYVPYITKSNLKRCDRKRYCENGALCCDTVCTVDGVISPLSLTIFN